LQVWAEPIKIFRYNKSSGANSVAILRAKTKFEKTSDSHCKQKC